jgi:acetyl esterase/lipase
VNRREFIAGAPRAVRLCAALVVLLPLLALGGCTGALLAIANGADLVNGDYSRETDLAYGTLPRHRADVYTPAATVAPARRVVVFFHGGGWRSGSKDDYRFLAAGLAGAGFVVVVPNYRLYPQARFAESMSDAAAAVAWAQSNAARWGATPDGVIAMGHSAGAQLAAMLATDRRWLARANARPLAAFAGFAGPYDFLPLTDPELMEYFGPPARYPESQPVNYVLATTPPAFLVHGDADTRVLPRNTDSLERALRAAHVPVEVHRPAGEGHARVLARFVRMYRGGDAVYAALLRFLASPPTRAASTATADTRPRRPSARVADVVPGGRAPVGLSPRDLRATAVALR